MGREQEDDEAARAEPAPDPVQAGPATEERPRVSIVERGARLEPGGGRHDHEKCERNRGTDNDAAERPGPRGRHERRGEPRREGEARKRGLPRRGAPVARAERDPRGRRPGLHPCRVLHEGDIERPGGEERGAGDRDGLEGYGHAGSAPVAQRGARTAATSGWRAPDERVATAIRYYNKRRCLSTTSSCASSAGSTASCGGSTAAGRPRRRAAGC